MRLQNLFNDVKDWAANKGILGPKGQGTLKAQWEKVLEEINETHEAMENYRNGAGALSAVKDLSLIHI